MFDGRKVTTMDAAAPDMRPLLGQLVHRAVVVEGWTFGEAARRMHLSEPTLRKMRETGDVSDRFYSKAEAALDLPVGLLLAMKTGDVPRVRELMLSDKLTDEQRSLIAAVIDAPKRQRRTS